MRDNSRKAGLYEAVRRLGHQHVPTTASRGDHQAHCDEEEIVVPAVAGLAPEASVPDEDLLLDCTQHDENESYRGQLRQDTQGDSYPTGELCEAQEASEPGAHADALASSDRIPGVTPAAPDKHPADQQTHEEESNVTELIKKGEAHQEPRRRDATAEMLI